MFPPSGHAQFLDILRADRAPRIDAARQKFAAFLAIFARHLDQVAVRRLETEFAEIKVFIEGRVGRPEHPLIFGRKIVDREVETWPNIDRIFLPLAFIGYEEMETHLYIRKRIILD